MIVGFLAVGAGLLVLVVMISILSIKNEILFYTMTILFGLLLLAALFSIPIITE